MQWSALRILLYFAAIMIYILHLASKRPQTPGFPPLLAASSQSPGLGLLYHSSLVLGCPQISLPIYSKRLYLIPWLDLPIVSRCVSLPWTSFWNTRFTFPGAYLTSLLRAEIPIQGLAWPQHNWLFPRVTHLSQWCQMGSEVQAWSLASSWLSSSNAPQLSCPQLPLGPLSADIQPWLTNSTAQHPSCFIWTAISLL